MTAGLRVRCVSAGYSLIEVVLSLVLLSIIMASVSSAVMFASSASPADDSVEVSLATDSRVISQIAEDLAEARYVTEKSDNAVTVVVADRTGDGNPDRIRYAWVGTEGKPITYQINNEEPVELISSAKTFSLSYTNSNEASALAVASYFGDETVIDGYTQTDSVNERQIWSEWWYGQIITPSFSPDAMGFIPTRLRLYASYKPPITGQSLVELRDRSGTQPGGTTFASYTVDETVLDWAFRWEDFDFNSARYIESAQDLSVTISHIAGNNVSMNVAEAGAGSGLLFSSDSGATWAAETSKTMVYELLGRELLHDSELYTVTHERLPMITVTLQSLADKRSPLTRRVRLLNAPPSLTAFAETGFDGDPTPVDLNGDGETELVHSGTLTDGAISDGVWTCDGTFTFKPGNLSNAEVITVSARMRANDTLGPTIYGPFTVNPANEMLPVVTQLRINDDDEQELVLYNSTELETEFAIVSDLPSGLIDVKLTVIPDQDYVLLEVNHEPVAAYLFERIADPGTEERAIHFGSSGGVAEFGSIRVHVGGSASARTRGIEGVLIPDIPEQLFTD